MVQPRAFFCGSKQLALVVRLADEIKPPEVPDEILLKAALGLCAKLHIEVKRVRIPSRERSFLPRSC